MLPLAVLLVSGFPISESISAVSHDSHVSDRGPKVELFEHMIMTRVLQRRVESAILIVHVAEYDCLSRTRLLASGLNRAVGQRFTSTPGLNLAVFDALHAHRTFFHDATTANRDVRVEHQVL